MTDRVLYTGDEDETTRKQRVGWGGNSDPAEHLEPGRIYEVQRREVHTWHTKLHLTDKPGLKFNSTHFDDVPESPHAR